MLSRKGLDTYSRKVKKEKVFPVSHSKEGLLRGYEMQRAQEVRTSQLDAKEKSFFSDGDLRKLDIMGSIVRFVIGRERCLKLT